MPSRKSFKLERLGPLWAAPGLVAGVDEAGRGPLAGPVVAAAVILDELRPIRGLADSKVLTEKRREALSDQIRAHALCFAIASASVEEIDDLNILQATMLAMQRAVMALRLLPHRVVVDGNRRPALTMPVAAIVQGDARVKAISAASILAKVHRDGLCRELHERHPDYGFAAHKGYCTPEHLAALQRYGPCDAHRRSYAPVRARLNGCASDAAGCEPTATATATSTAVVTVTAACGGEAVQETTHVLVLEGRPQGSVGIGR